MRTIIASAGYLTGSKKIIKNDFNGDFLIERQSRTLRQMFFQPYESKAEFIYCSRHTFQPLAILGLAILDPLLLLVVPVFIGGASLVCATLGAINKICGNENGAAFFLRFAEYLIKDLCQALIDTVVLPLSVLVVLTRGISTGLQAAGIYGEQDEEYEEPEELSSYPEAVFGVAPLLI